MAKTWRYQYEARSADGFLAQLIRYINAGHFFYVSGRIPQHKCLCSVDVKLLDRYEIAMPRWQRARRKQSGIASVHYLRFENFFLLIATHGKHLFFEAHSAKQILDCRRTGIQFEGYSIRRGYSNHTKKWHTLVRLDAETYQNLRAYMLEICSRRSKEQMEDEFRSVWFQPYRPVREQLFSILRAVNRQRKACGFAEIDYRLAIRNRRRICRSFT